MTLYISYAFLLDPDCILDYAIEYATSGTYPDSASKNKRRSIRKRAKTITVENGEVFLKRKKGKVCY